MTDCVEVKINFVSNVFFTKINPTLEYHNDSEEFAGFTFTISGFLTRRQWRTQGDSGG